VNRQDGAGPLHLEQEVAGQDASIRVQQLEIQRAQGEVHEDRHAETNAQQGQRSKIDAEEFPPYFAKAFGCRERRQRHGVSGPGGGPKLVDYPASRAFHA
jgi:hypothetical protein